MSGGLQVSRGGNGPAGMTSITASIPNTSTTVSLVTPSNIITIVNYSTATGVNSIIYLNFLGAATASNFAILPGGAFTYDGVAVQSFQIIGSAAGDTYGVFAH